MSSSLLTHIPKVDVVRISQNIHKNLIRESREYAHFELETADVKLNDKDQILDFGDHKHDEEENTDNVVAEEEKFEKNSESIEKIDKIGKIGKNEKFEKNEKIKKKANPQKA